MTPPWGKPIPAQGTTMDTRNREPGEIRRESAARAAWRCGREPRCLWRVDVDEGVGQAADVVQQVMSWAHHTDAVTLSEICS